MPRNPNTDLRANPFSRSVIVAVWSKGRTIPGYDSSVWRHDVCGNSIKYQDYGNTTSQHGWEVDHIRPVSKGGTDDLNNLQPLQWDNNRRKGDTFPWSCS